ncbi:MAG: ABC transporter permease, partial [Clostridia bacterium]|nr:ABC transporter permease [Clostridia bacterium]
MKSAAFKDIIREIKNSRNRFLAIMVLSALAVAFLCGLKVTAPDMKGTGDDYLDEQRLMDIQVMSTLGITDEDIAELGSREEIDYALGAYVMDAWAGDAVAKVYSITQDVNRLVLMEGHMPVVSRECAVDAHLMEKLGLSIGDYLPILPSEDNEDSLIYDDFRIVGIVRSPYYVSVERGSASIGSGSVQGYVYLKEKAFKMDCYTIAYLGVKGAQSLTAFTDEYNDRIEEVIDGLEPLGEVRAQLRYDEIIDEAMEEIAEAEQELADAEQEVADEIAEAEQELADARKELDDGWYEYRKGKKELEEAYPDLMEGEAELWDGYYELMDGEAEYDDGVKQYEEGLAKFEAERDKMLPQLEQGKAEIDAGFKQIDDYYADKAGIEKQI